eukprot:TRINITY_DN2062_c2_g1_i1.p1 TRINITY_DN2062_c2_g1~~TRINITY_DN2062_c2_g1_i1.p1  ORF type:complete len:279 (-),score=56.61 TRINITY_DN2062_c2_g1_i1:163-957(-)
MAGTWRVVIETLDKLQRPQYRAGDKLRKLGHKITSDGADAELRNLYIEVASGKKVIRTRAFHVPEGCQDQLMLNAVIFVPEPPRGEQMVVRVLKMHKLQADALLGEATFDRRIQHHKLSLLRGGKESGQISLSVSSGLPSALKAPATAPPAKASSSVPSPVPSTKNGSSEASVQNSTDTSKPQAESPEKKPAPESRHGGSNRLQVSPPTETIDKPSAPPRGEEATASLASNRAPEQAVQLHDSVSSCFAFLTSISKLCSKETDA